MSENVNVTGWIYDVRKKRQVTVPTKKDKEPIVETWYKVSWCKMSRTKQGRRSKFVIDKIAVPISPSSSKRRRRHKQKHMYAPITHDGKRVHTWVLEKLIPEAVLEHVSKLTGRASSRVLRNVMQSNRRCSVPKLCHPHFANKSTTNRQTKLSWGRSKRKSCEIASTEEECSDFESEQAQKKGRQESQHGLRICTEDGFPHPFTWYVLVTCRHYHAR